MPWAPLPPDAEEFLRQPNPAVIATVRPDGELLTVTPLTVSVDPLAARMLIPKRGNRK